MSVPLLAVTLHVLLYAFTDAIEQRVVSLCSEEIAVLFPGERIVFARLSEPVADSSVSVRCSPVENENSSIGLEFKEVVAPIGLSAIEVNFTVVSSGKPVEVSCTAQSLTGSQYDRATSKGQSTVFKIVSPLLYLHPPKSLFYGLSVDVTLQLHPAVPSLEEGGGEVIFQCVIEQWNATLNSPEMQTERICNDSAVLSNVQINQTKDVPIMIMPGQIPITFQPGDSFQKFTIERNSAFPADANHSALYLVSCCFSSVESSGVNLQSFSQLSAHHLMSVQLSPVFNVSLAGSPDCFCDVTLLACDVNCCCDGDCQADDTRTFTSCANEKTSEYKRNCGYSQSKELDAFVCVQKDNNPNLGLTYSSTASASDESKFNSLRNSVKHFTYERGVISDLVTKVGSQTIYKSGDIILTSTDDALSLPAETSFGCTDFGYVSFLEDSQSVCRRPIDESTCMSSSPLSLSYYLHSNNSFDGCSSHVSIRGSPQSSVSVDINYIYYCKGSVNKSQESTALFSNDSVETQSYGLCSPEENLLPSFRDGHAMCVNAVESVRYGVFWSRGEVVLIQVEVVLVNVTSGSVKQTYDVKFYHVPDVYKHLTSENISKLKDDSHSQSGNPGYSLKAKPPLLSGTLSSNGGAVDGNASSVLRKWRGLKSGICSDVGREAVSFGEDSMSGCVLQLSAADLKDNCAYISEIVKMEQEALLSATHIGRYGASKRTVKSDWVEIIRGNDSLIGLNSSDFSPPVGLCGNVSAQGNLFILISPLTEDPSADQWQVVGAKIWFSLENWSYSCAGSDGSGCSDSALLEKQPFSVTTSIRYVVVSAKKYPRKAKSEAQSDDTVCKYDACLGDVLYPFMLNTEGFDQQKQKTLAWGLLGLLAIVGVLGAIRPCF